MTPEQAIAETRKIAAAHTWPLDEPVRAYRQRHGFLWRRTRWLVVSNAGGRGCNVRVTFDDVTGEVVRKGFALR